MSNRLLILFLLVALSFAFELDRKSTGLNFNYSVCYTSETPASTELMKGLQTTRLTDLVFEQSMPMLFFNTTGNQPLEFFSGSGTAVNGPVTTNQTLTFIQNTDNPTGNIQATHVPAMTATYSITNRFSSIEGNPTVPGLNFGGNISTTQNTPPLGAAFVMMNAIGAPQDTHFSSASQCIKTGISVANNFSESFTLYSDALIGSNGLPNYPGASAGNLAYKDSVYYGNITITFNRPVTNPLIHFAGLGGFRVRTTNNSFNQPTASTELGFSARMALLDPGLTFTRLSGSTYFNVSDTVVRNSAPNKGSPTLGAVLNPNHPSSPVRYAASGTVRVNGENLTSVTFRVYLQGDGGIQLSGPNTPIPSPLPAIRWAMGISPTDAEGAATGAISGDGFQVGASIVPVYVSGTVFNDQDALNDNAVDGVVTGLAGASQLYAYLVDGSNNIIDSARVLSNGTYSLSTTATGTYTVRISTSSSAIGASVPASNLPSGFEATGDDNPTVGVSDGTPDLNQTVVISVADFTNGTNKIDYNFGIRLCTGDKDGDLICDNVDPDDDNDGITDKAEQDCNLSGTWTQISAGVWETVINANQKVRVTFGDYTNFWDAAAPSNVTNFDRACANYTSDFSPINNVGNDALQFQSGGASGTATSATFTVQYLDLSNNPITIANPIIHMAGLGGSATSGLSQFVTSSAWKLLGGNYFTVLSSDATDFRNKRG